MGKKHDETLSLVREAIRQLRRGDSTDALTTLERCAYPKWRSDAECAVDLMRHNQEAAPKSAAA